MNSNQMFWIGAFSVALLAILVAVRGVAYARKGIITRHRVWMNTSIALIFIFVAAYLCKVITLGREDLSTWSTSSVVLLRFHETVVTVMLVSGIYARLLAKKALGSKLRAPFDLRHRIAGRISIGAALLVLLTGFFVLIGMLMRG